MTGKEMHGHQPGLQAQDTHVHLPFFLETLFLSRLSSKVNGRLAAFSFKESKFQSECFRLAEAMFLLVCVYVCF